MCCFAMVFPQHSKRVCSTDRAALCVTLCHSFQQTSEFCEIAYPNPDCTCPLGADPALCPVETCYNATTTSCGAEIGAARDARGFGSLQVDRCLIYNSTGERFECRDTSSFILDFQLEGSVSMFLPTLNDTEIEMVGEAYASTESLDRTTLQAWAETDVTLFGCLLLLLSIFQMVREPRLVILACNVRANGCEGPRTGGLVLIISLHRLLRPGPAHHQSPHHQVEPRQQLATWQGSLLPHAAYGCTQDRHAGQGACLDGLQGRWSQRAGSSRCQSASHVYRCA